MPYCRSVSLVLMSGISGTVSAMQQCRDMRLSLGFYLVLPSPSVWKAHTDASPRTSVCFTVSSVSEYMLIFRTYGIRIPYAV